MGLTIIDDMIKKKMTKKILVLRFETKILKWMKIPKSY